MEGANRSNHSYKFFLPVSEETKRALSRAPPFSPSSPTLVSSARGCLHKKNKQNKKKRMTQNIDACVARNDREGRKRSGEEREKKKEKRKKEGTMRRVSSWPINFLSPPSFQLFSPRVRATMLLNETKQQRSQR